MNIVKEKAVTEKAPRNMMPECDLDDNDPLSLYLKKTLAEASTAPPSTNHAGRSVSLPADNGNDSISDVTRQHSQNINHDKVKETEVSKQTD